MRWCLLLAALLGLGARAAPAGRAYALPVLCYHKIAPEAKDGMTATPAQFAMHMQYLKKFGYQPIRLEQAREFLWGALKLKGKPVLITFDDGYEGVYRYGLPILEHYGFPACMFLVVGAVGHPGHLSLDELRELQGSGLFDFGSHTYNLHVHIPHRLNMGAVYPNQIVSDLRRSRAELKRLLGVDTRAFAWPYGHYNLETINLAAKAGFTMQFTLDFGATRPPEGTLRIRRIRVHREDNSLAVLRHKLESVY